MDKLPTAADFFVPYLPGQPSGSRSVIQFAGHLPSHPPSSRRPTRRPRRSGKRRALFGGSDDDEKVKEDEESKEPDAHLWFWLVKARHVADQERLIIWFNGGPGCSSLDGGLMELGPFKVKDVPLSESAEPELEVAKYAWTEYANVLFLDQPAGTGYSYVNVGDDVRELQQAADQVLVFLQNFYRVFPEFSRMQTYLAGESYAGQYIPYVAASILETTTLSTPLKGLLMGNAWLDPPTQYEAYLDFAYERGILKRRSKQARKAEEAWNKCHEELDRLKKQPPRGSGSKDGGANKGGTIVVDVCEDMLGVIMQGGEKKVDGKTVRPVSYNVTQYQAPDEEWPTQVRLLTRYLDRRDVAEAFHASHKASRWAQCNNTVGVEMRSPLSAPSISLLPKLLSSDPSSSTEAAPPALKMLFYAGMQDFICSGLGMNRTIEKLEWGGAIGWDDPEELKEQGPEEDDEEAEDRKMVGSDDDERWKRQEKKEGDVGGSKLADTGVREWWVDERRVGSWRERNGVGYVEFDSASHMVPMDEPAASLDMLLRFLDIHPLTSAGPSSLIPSHLGSSKSGGVLGTLHPNGSALTEGDPDYVSPDSPFHSGDGLEDDQRVEVDRNRTAYYGPRRTTTLVLILLIIAGSVWVLVRFRRGRRKGRIGLGRSNGKASAPIKLESPKPSSRKKKHARFASRGESRRLGEYANPSTARLLKEDATDGRNSDLELGRGLPASVESFVIEDEEETDPDVAGDIGFSQRREEQDRKAEKGEAGGQVLFDRDEE